MSRFQADTFASFERPTPVGPVEIEVDVTVDSDGTVTAEDTGRVIVDHGYTGTRVRLTAAEMAECESQIEVCEVLRLAWEAEEARAEDLRDVG